MFEASNIVNHLTSQFELINSNRVSTEVLEYLKSVLSNLTIEICGDYVGNIIELMSAGKLDGCAWQTTESAIVFFDDNDYIERGYLKFSENETYYHSWICFKYKNELYVFDACLNLICKKEWFDIVFKPKVIGTVTAKEVREELVYRINYPKMKKMSDEEKYMLDFLTELCPNAVAMQDRETIISGDENVNSPMYRNYTGYIAEIEEDQIRKLTAHYYNSSI